MKRPLVLHLVDDATPGGVQRVVDYMLNSEKLAETARHRLVRVPRAASVLPDCQADLIVSHLTLNWRNFLARSWFRAKHPAIPIVHAEHSYTAGFTAQSVTQKSRFFSLLRTGYSLFDHVVAVSEAQQNWMLKRGLCQPDCLSVIRPCVDLEAFAGLQPPSGPPRVFGLIGRLVEIKGYDIAIRAFMECQNPDIRLEVFGEGPAERELIALAKHDSRITFHGFSKDPLKPFRSIDALLVPSRSESFGLVALEARVAGRSVIAAQVDGLKDQAGIGSRMVSGSGYENWRRAIEAAATSCGTTLNIRNNRAEMAKLAQRRFEVSWDGLVQSLSLRHRTEAPS